MRPIILLNFFIVCFPLFLIWTITFKKFVSLTSWKLTAVIFALAILSNWATAPWYVVSIYLRNLFPALYIIACLVGYQRVTYSLNDQILTTPKFELIVGVGLIVIFLVLNLMIFRGYYTYKNTVELMSPLRNKQYCVGQGGASPFLNHHFLVKPQNYALDIVGIGRFGMRRASTFTNSSTLEDYAIYGDFVYAPCAGEIVVVVNEFDDLIPPKTDTENVAGNHILIVCNDVEVLLAHLRKDSIRVEKGDLITPNDILAQVGNSGNTTEPHLHIHVESGGKPDTIFNGAAVPFTINSKFLVRGSTINEKNL